MDNMRVFDDLIVSITIIFLRTSSTVKLFEFLIHDILHGNMSRSIFHLVIDVFSEFTEYTVVFTEYI